MRAVLAALTLITSGAEARGTEIYRNYTDKRHHCFEHSRPAQRRLKKQKADAEAAGAAPADDKAAKKAAKEAKKEAKAYEKEGRRRDALPACGAALRVPARPPSLWCQAHRLRFPTRCGRSVLCVPQKNGNRDFGLLIYAMTYGKIPQREISKGEKGKHPDLWMTTVTATDTVYVVSRNPYTRLLSLYLDKVLRCFGEGEKTGKKGSVNCDHDLLAQSGAFPDGIADMERTPKRAPSFADFVKLVEEATERYDLCQVDHHLCLQSQGCLLNGARRLQLLRLEHMQSWFPCLNETLGLTFLEGAGWRRWKSQPCFYGDCGGAEASNVGAVHPTGASDRVGEFYDDKTAAAALRLYREDFEILGYPTALPLTKPM